MDLHQRVERAVHFSQEAHIAAAHAPLFTSFSNCGLSSTTVMGLARSIEEVSQRTRRLESSFALQVSQTAQFAADGHHQYANILREVLHEALQPIREVLRCHERLITELVTTMNFASAWGVGPHHQQQQQAPLMPVVAAEIVKEEEKTSIPLPSPSPLPHVALTSQVELQQRIEKLKRLTADLRCGIEPNINNNKIKINLSPNHAETNKKASSPPPQDGGTSSGALDHSGGTSTTAATTTDPTSTAHQGSILSNVQKMIFGGTPRRGGAAKAVTFEHALDSTSKEVVLDNPSSAATTSTLTSTTTTATEHSQIITPVMDTSSYSEAYHELQHHLSLR